MTGRDKVIGTAAVILSLGWGASAQSGDPGAAAVQWLKKHTEDRLQFSLESRGRYENREGVAFGKEPDRFTGLYRTRLGMTLRAASWLKISAMAQDARAPWYGVNAPSSVRDGADLQEAYFELFPDRKTGFGMSAGRQMLNYGETRLLGSPQWGNVARSWDHARLYWRHERARLEFLALSPVKVRLDGFNTPAWGDRIWGVYNSFPKLAGKTAADVYILRHDQNRPGGYTGGSKAQGTDRLRTNTFGARVAGPLPGGARYSVEGIGQTGKVGAARHRAAAWFSGVSRRWTAASKPLDLSAEYKFASGARDPRNPSRSGTFDQLYPANHDKFGHADLFGWRNIHMVRPQAVYGFTKSVALNFMYANSWLASRRDALYNGSGKAMFQSASGAAGRHIGQEADLFFTYKRGRMQFGAGYGHFFPGEFVRKASPGRSHEYLYVFHTYSVQ